MTDVSRPQSREQTFSARQASALMTALDSNHDYGERAAVWLLYRHGAWFNQPEFAATYMRFNEDRTSGEILWEEAFDAVRQHRLSISHSADQILMFACSLARNIAIEPRRVINPLDTRNASLVAEAFTRACGVDRA